MKEKGRSRMLRPFSVKGKGVQGAWPTGRRLGSAKARARRRDCYRAVKYNQAMGSYPFAVVRKLLIISIVKERPNGRSWK